MDLEPEKEWWSDSEKEELNKRESSSEETSMRLRRLPWRSLFLLTKSASITGFWAADLLEFQAAETEFRLVLYEFEDESGKKLPVLVLRWDLRVEREREIEREKEEGEFFELWRSGGF